MARQKVNVDWALVTGALVLSFYGIAIVYSAGQTDIPIAGYIRNAWKQQLVWFMLGIIGAYAMSRASIRMLEWLAVPLYAFTTALLVLLIFIGKGAGTAASVKSWLVIGGFRLGQPSEIAKLTVVLMLGKILAGSKDPPKSFVELWKPALVVGIPWILIMAQPDLGTGIVFVGIFFAMLFWSGISWRLLLLLASPVVSLILTVSTQLWGAWFLLLLALVIWYKPYLWEGVFLVAANVVMGVLAPILWERLEPYQQNRLRVFLDPSVDPRRSGYHVIQSQVAIGSGGWFGKGYTMGTQKRLAFLPEQHTDFIFSVLGEELGFLGVVVALTLFLTLFLRIIRIAERANDSFSSLVAFGLLASWFVHVVVNVSMTLNLMPITGIPLPFFSYGGSFMLASWLAVGVLVRIAHEGRGGKHGPFAI
ncbi:MAG TPA: rod shape-determining protein RodA [Gemmatimonadaceae bacterium]|nr:rod shape-determining protein RodA [Gemmatimonadaceae bacterium]